MLIFRYARVYLAACVSLTPLIPGEASAQNIPVRIRAQTDQIEVQANGASAETMHTELQVLTAAAVTQFGQLPIGYVESMQNLDVLEAYTQKADGRKITVEPSGIVTRQPPGSSPLPLFSDAKQKVIIFPNVEPGDTLIFTARRRDKATLFPSHYMRQYDFPPTLPLDAFDLTVTAPKRLGMVVEGHELEFKKAESGNNEVYTLHYANLNPTAEDNAAVSQLDRVPRYFLSSFKSYDELAQTYAGMFEAKAGVTRKIQAQADSITAGITDRREQARAIYEWVSQHVRYVEVALGQGAIVPHDAESVLNNAYGDCKDHTALFTALLKAKGIDSRPVLINLGNGYTLSSIPTLGQLNHVIAWLPEFGIYADTTAGIVPFGFLPQAEYGKPIVLVGKSDAGLRQIPVLPPDSGTITYRNAAKLDDMMRLTSEGTTTATGVFSGPLRFIGQRIQSTGAETTASNILKQRGMPNATGTFNVAATGLAPEYSIGAKFTTPGSLNLRVMEAGLRVLNPTGDLLMGPLNNAKLKDTDPTPCYSGHQVEDLTLEFPATKALVKLPQDADVSTANLRFTSHWSVNGQTLSVHREFTSNIAQPLCSGDIRKETVAALARIWDDYTTPISLTAKAGFAPTTVSFSPSDKSVSPASPASAGEAPTTQSGLATSENAPHIDSITLSEDRTANGLFVVQEFVFHSPKGNAATLHFDVVSVSAPAPNIRLTDGKIGSPKDQQQRGAIHVARFNCGPFRNPYSVVKRAMVIDADGEKSNSVDFTVRCTPSSAPGQQ
jgi:transglutaminase-like putative cysteine protease